MASIISFIKAWQLTADLVQRFVEAWLSSQIQDIQNDHSKQIAARSVLIKKIDQARKEKNREELVSLNHALAVLERGKL
jgi:hypothetical protein